MTGGMRRKGPGYWRKGSINAVGSAVSIRAVGFGYRRNVYWSPPLINELRWY